MSSVRRSPRRIARRATVSSRNKHLADRSRVAILNRIMKCWSWHRTLVLFLAVLLGLGMSLSSVQGSVMAMAMSIPADGAYHASSHCEGCGGGDHKDMNTATCLTLCASAAQALISGDLLTPPSASRTGYQIAQQLVSGRSHTPDHGPPKTLTLG